MHIDATKTDINMMTPSSTWSPHVTSGHGWWALPGPFQMASRGRITPGWLFVPWILWILEISTLVTLWSTRITIWVNSDLK